MTPRLESADILNELIENDVLTPQTEDYAPVYFELSTAWKISIADQTIARIKADDELDEPTQDYLIDLVERLKELAPNCEITVLDEINDCADRLAQYSGKLAIYTIVKWPHHKRLEGIDGEIDHVKFNEAQPNPRFRNKNNHHRLRLLAELKDLFCKLNFQEKGETPPPPKAQPTEQLTLF